MLKKVRMSFQEKPFLYDWEEWQRWRDPGDKGTVDSLLDRCGDLVKPRKSILDQVKKGKGSAHYAEVKYAIHLEDEDEGFRDNIVYENYTLSYQYANELIGKPGLKAIGTAQLRDIFSDNFFKIFDQLYQINRTIIKNQCANLHVDLCAINPRKKEVSFCEIKKYNRGYNKPEKLSGDQLIVLGFIRYIIDNLVEKVFYHKVYKVKTELIVFIAKDDIRLINLIQTNPREHSIEFAV
jgi:hypothetical protein